jgi:hypothetical protein
MSELVLTAYDGVPDAPRVAGWVAEYSACRAYAARSTARPAFKKADLDQIAHFAAGDVRVFIGSGPEMTE